MKKNKSLKLVLPIILSVFFISCGNFLSLDDMIKGFNRVFDPKFEEVKVPSVNKEPTLIPEESYSVEQPYELMIQGGKGYMKYVWSFTDSNGKNYDVNSGLSVLRINTSVFEKGEYTLTLDTVDINGDKFNDTATVIIY